MGVVYRVLDRATGETRALKRMNAEAAARPLLVEAFEREYRVLSSLDHPRIIRVFDYEVDDQGPYYTMEFLEGTDLRKSAPLEYRRACRYLRDIATTLALLHARRLIHRDLSPSNVRMTDDGHVKLLDFGALMSFGTTSLVVGTPPAVPPEAMAEAPLDQRTDLYALGALAYWLLTRTHAYPARRVQDLPELWKQPPVSPSTCVPGIPRELDQLILALLSADPLARPASAAEVIARLRVIGDLPLEQATEADQLAQSFFSSPGFTGRAEALEQLGQQTRAAIEGRGAAVRVEAAAGMGRTRLLEEIGVRAQLAGAAVVRIDASMHRQMLGAIRALVARVLDGFPDLTRDHVGAFRPALAALGREIEARLPQRGPTSSPHRSPESRPEVAGTIEQWFVALSDEKPLILLVDNVEYADTTSLGILAGLAAVAKRHPLLLVVTERTRREGEVPLGLATLRSHASSLVLSAFRPSEMLELVRSVFGDAPNVERFSEWLHGRAAGSPMHAIELTRHLVAKHVVQYAGGVWTLPVDRPDTELPAGLEDALLLRIQSLGAEARALAECLSLQDQEPTRELCRLLVGGEDERRALALLDELAFHDVLHADRDGYRFSSTAIREALFSGMSAAVRAQNHRRLGEVFAELAGEDDAILRVEAGFHLIRGGDELRGADLIASITHDASAARARIANLHHLGAPLEAALQVYRRHRRSIYERMPILSALAHAGYYEDRVWGERYGDEALDVLEYVSGVRRAQRLRPLLGKWLSLIVGLLFAFLRFQLVPRRERPYPFGNVLVGLFGTVTALTGAASLSLDVERARRVADALEPFSILPDRLTPAGIYQFCRALEDIGQEHEARAYAMFDTLLARFQNPRYYPTLPMDARSLYVDAAHFARGAFAIFRADGRAALESATALEASDNKLYAMIGSQLRFLYYMNRGEFARAAPYREKVELYAAQVGSAWQVETWEAPALILVHATLSDILGSTRVAKRLDVMSETMPSLRLYAQLANAALRFVNNDAVLEARQSALATLDTHAPRSFIGWAAVCGYVARGTNQLGETEMETNAGDGTKWFREAKGICERAWAHVVEEDREYVSIFLGLDLELARADAALGDVTAGLSRIDGLLERFRDIDHPLVHGLLHETRARIALASGDVDSYRASCAEVDRWFRPTGTPALIAKCERLAALRPKEPKEFDSAPASNEPRRRAASMTSSNEPTTATVVEVPDMTTETLSEAAAAHPVLERS